MPKLAGELGPLERRVMDQIWDRGEDATVRDLTETPGIRGLAYTTVMTVLDRLWQKGFVARRRVGRAYSYRARMTRERYLSTLVGQVFAASDDRRSVLLGFARKIDGEDLAELRKMIRDVESRRSKRRP
jgi:BlaI family transcriptional regulator, penicillinase repressor